MPSENYDFVPWDSPDDIHKFFNFDDIEKWAPLVGLLTRVGAQGAANAVATQGVRGAMKTGLGKLGTGLKVALGGGLKNIKAKVGVKGGGAATEAAGAAEGMASAAEAVESAAPKPSLPKASDGTDSVPLPESPAAEPAAEIPEPEEPSGAGGNKTDYKKVGMQLAGQMQAQNAQRKQAQEQRAMEMARRGASVQTGEPMNLAWRLLKEEDDEVPDPRKFKMPQEDYVEALRERAKRIKGRQADPNMAENTENVPMGLKEKVPFTQPPGGGPIQLPTKLTPPNASQGIQRRVHPFTREGTFEGLSLDTPDADPKKYFTRSEPMGIAYQLLKEQIDYENQMELAPHEQLWNDEADEHLKTKTNELFDYAIAQGIDPGDLLDTWHDRASMVEGLNYGEPGSELGFRAHAIDPSQWKKLASEPMDIAFQLLKEAIDVSGQHAPRNDPRFWDVMRHYGKQNLDMVDKPVQPYSSELAEMSPQVNELLASYGYEPYYFGGEYPNPDLDKKNYNTGHLAIFDPGVAATSFGANKPFTDNWRKLHELGHAQGLEDLNAEWGEGRRLGKLGQRTPREMLRAIDWETRALGNQRKLMEEIGLPIQESEYNRDWNTTIGDAGFRALTGQFTSPEGEGFEAFSEERVPAEIAMRKVREKAEELGLDMDETLRDKRGGARKVASEPMEIAMQLLKWESQTDMHAPSPRNFNEYFGIKDSWVSLPKEGMDARPQLYDEVANAMNIAYKPVGGHDKYSDGNDLKNEGKHARYDMIDNDQDPYVDAARVFSQQEQGFKASITAHDGQTAAKRATVDHMTEHMQIPGHYIEVSGAWPRIFDKQGMQPITDYDHIRELVNRPLRETETAPGTYTRKIGDNEREKQIFGSPMRDGATWADDFMQQATEASRNNSALVLNDYNFPKSIGVM